MRKAGTRGLDRNMAFGGNDYPTLRDIELFVCVMLAGSFSAAGRSIGMSPASVSRHISALEDRMGVRLLNRTSRSLGLTEAGATFFKRAERLLGDARELRQMVTQEHSQARGMLNVHSRMLVGLQYIAPALPGFLAQYPEIKIDLRLSNEDPDLVENNIDISIRIGHLDDSTLIARKLTSSERWLCATPEYLRTAPPLTAPEDLAAHNCLTYLQHLGLVHWRFMAPGGALSEFAVQGNLRTTSGPALHVAMMKGLGIALMPDWSVRDEVASGRLVRLLPEYQVSFTSFDNAVYAVYSPTHHLPMKARAFIDYLAAHFQSSLAAALDDPEALSE